MLIKEQTVQECDATKDEFSYAAGYTKDQSSNILGLQNHTEELQFEQKKKPFAGLLQKILIMNPVSL
jgi:hypothetical protein